MCVLGPLAACFDRSSDCDERLRSCAESSEYTKRFMMENCKETCGFCGAGRIFEVIRLMNKLFKYDFKVYLIRFI